MSLILQIKDLNFSYKSDGRSHPVLRNFCLDVQKGEYISIKGPSGSGKSTLFYLIGTLLKANSGEIYFKEDPIHTLSDEQLCYFRNNSLGFVFQQFHLLPRATVLENILLPAAYPMEQQDQRLDYIDKAKSLARRLGLEEHLQAAPNKLSGGQQQRVAIARALLKDVDLILADEPTGNLDSKSADEVLRILDELHLQGKTIIMITHDDSVASRASRVLEFRDGIIQSERENSKPTGTGTNQHVHKNNSAQNHLSLISNSHWIFRNKQYFTNLLPLVFANLLRNKSKSFLTMFGVTIGVAAVLSMLSLGDFTKDKILEGYKAVGVNQIEFSAYPEWGRGRRAFARASATKSFVGFNEKSDLNRLQDLMPEIQFISPKMDFSNMKISFAGLGNPEQSYGVLGINQDYFAILNVSIAIGRLISIHDVEIGSRICVIGSDIPTQLGVSPDIILGEALMLTDQNVYAFSCRVIGVLAGGSDQTSAAASEIRNKIFVPHSMVSKIALPWHAGIWNVVASLKDQEKLDVIESKLKSFFTQKYEDSISFNFNQKVALIHQMRRFLSIFKYLLGAIAFLSLVVGGIGIHNMMLVSVVDRLKEIGLRKAIGATQKSIRFLFLMESVVLCSLAGILGILIGFCFYQSAIYAASVFIQDLKFQWVFNSTAILVSMLSIFVVGIFSGMVPAKKAEKLEIIEALRSE